jgi:hypothetical protein
MTREGAARIALWAYPPTARAATGEEIVSTLLDVGAGSRRRFAREIVDLARLGLRARAAQSSAAGARRLIADGLCLAAIWILTLDLSTLGAQRLRGMHDPLLGAPSIALLAATLALGLVGLDRVAGAGALAWTALRLPDLLDRHPGLTGLAPEVLPILCLVALLVVPRRRDLDLRRLAWLAVPAGLIVALGPRAATENPALVLAILAGVAGAVAFALAMLPADPRVAIAGAVPLSNLAIAVMTSHHDMSVVALVWLAATPAVLGLAIARAPRRAAMR